MRLAALAAVAAVLHPCPIRRAEALAGRPGTGPRQLRAAYERARERHEAERAAIAFLGDEAESHDGAEGADLRRRLAGQERRFLDGADRLERVQARLDAMQGNRDVARRA